MNAKNVGKTGNLNTYHKRSTKKINVNAMIFEISVKKAQLQLIYTQMNGREKQENIKIGQSVFFFKKILVYSPLWRTIW